jgi:hypothetical protein
MLRIDSGVVVHVHSLLLLSSFAVIDFLLALQKSSCAHFLHQLFRSNLGFGLIDLRLIFSKVLLLVVLL